MNGSRTVAAVDDDASIRESLEALLRSAGWPARSFSSAEEFLSSGAVTDSVCLLADMNMPGMTGLELSEELRKRGHSLTIILLTGYLDENIQKRAEPLNVILFPKPFDEDALLEHLETAARGSLF